MGDEDRGRDLPQRVRGAAQTWPPPSAPSSSSRALSEELRQRIEAAVKAERAEAAQEQKRTTEPPRGVTASGFAGSDLATPAVKQANRHSKRCAKPESAVRSIRTAKPERPAKPLRATRADRAAEPQSTAKVGPAARPKPIAEDNELTARLTPAAKPQRATKTEPAVRPQPAEGRSAARKPAAALGRTSRPAAHKPAVPKKLGRRRIEAGLVSFVLVGLVAGSLGVVAATHLDRSPSKVTPPSAAVLRQEAVNRRQTAAWVAEQVSHDVTVSCDKVMCAALEAHGFPLRNLVVLGPTSHADPVPSVVVVETAAVRDMFGSSLATAWAPAVLASFGSGTAGITVRVIAPHGLLAYQNLLSADLAARKEAGAGLLGDSQITVSAVARNQLASGQVDSRLMLALASLAGSQPINIVKFWNTGPGASAGIPLRFADLAGNDEAAHLSSSAYTRAVLADLSTANTDFRNTPQIRPARTVPAMLQGLAVLQVEFTAPTPLGVFGPK